MKLMPVINLRAGRGSNLANENSAQGQGLGQGFLDAPEDHIKLFCLEVSLSACHHRSALPLQQGDPVRREIMSMR